MAYKLEDLTNVIAPSGSFSKGRIRDDDGSRNGTPVNEQLLGDMTQLFAKLMAEANITPSGNPDNQNVNQIFDALRLVKSAWEDGTDTSPGTIASAGAFIGIEITSTAIELNVEPVNTVSTFVPTNGFPDGSTATMFVNLGLGETLDVQLNSANILTSQLPIKESGNTTANDNISIQPNEAIKITKFSSYWLLERL